MSTCEDCYEEYDLQAGGLGMTVDEVVDLYYGYDRGCVAYHLYTTMNQHQPWVRDVETWRYYREHGWDKGYLRLVDELLLNGYRPWAPQLRLAKKR